MSEASNGLIPAQRHAVNILAGAEAESEGVQLHGSDRQVAAEWLTGDPELIEEQNRIASYRAQRLGPMSQRSE